jgi:dephospho-CoA kinase
MIIIGLTGILGSGKSTVAALLRKRGLEVIDLDALARDSLRWKETQDDIKRVFGPEYVIDGTVDVERLKSVAFTKENLRTLETIVHPRVREKVKEKLDLLEKEGAPAVFVDHPLLFETGFYRRFHKIVVVDAAMDAIRERLKERGMDPGDAEQRLSFQLSLEVKKKMADYVIDNNGTEDRLEEQVDGLLEKIMKGEAS